MLITEIPNPLESLDKNMSAHDSYLHLISKKPKVDKDR